MNPMFTKLWLGRHRAKAAPEPQRSQTSKSGQHEAASKVPCEFKAAERDLTARYRAYSQTTPLDEIRRSDLQQLDTGETYMDWMGSAVYPRQLVTNHAELLLDPQKCFGNTHSSSQSSQLSSHYASTSRLAVLQFFDADPDEYAVIFTHNATAALKLVGESFPWTPSSSLIIGMDSHTSLHGIRSFAESGGARVVYYGCEERGGPNMADMQANLLRATSAADKHAASLLAITGLSNVTNAKASLRNVVDVARKTGAYVLVDAAALAPTSRISMRATPVDAFAVSFYKMLGYPTGVGALVVRRDFLRQVLRRPWFSGGTVDIVQVPGSRYTFTDDDEERFEDGTLNFLAIAAIPAGIAYLARYREILPLRLSILSHWLWSELEKTRYRDGQPMLYLASTPPTPLTGIGQESSTGATIAFLVLDPTGRPIRNDVIEATARGRVALRAGCMCNAGAVVTLLDRSGLFMDNDGQNLLRGFMENLGTLPSLAKKDVISTVLFNGDASFGLLRISLGFGTNFRDCWNVVQWLRSIPSLLAQL
ncbi:PLP-dependent transferase [Auriculariales sp. MPI-PUGE-AT-0066]|nr:PLP-dependent transferase [Auriculariales sp. MPI-PUGE-AT-0066]